MGLARSQVTFVAMLQVITTGGVTYKNEPWHRECFCCANCNTSLAGQRFTSKDDKPYCANCYGELFAKRCNACVKPITGTRRIPRAEETAVLQESVERSSYRSRTGTGTTTASSARSAPPRWSGRASSRTVPIFSAQNARRLASWPRTRRIAFRSSVFLHFYCPLRAYPHRFLFHVVHLSN